MKDLQLDELTLNKLGTAEEPEEVVPIPKQEEAVLMPSPETVMITVGDLTLNLSSYRENIFTLSNLALQLKDNLMNGNKKEVGYA